MTIQILIRVLFNKHQQYLLVVSICFCNLIVYAQSIQGKIQDTDKKPISHATILLKNETDSLLQSILANDNGEFSIDKVSPGKYVVIAKANGYKANTTNISISKVGESISNIVLILSKDTYQLKEIEITAVPDLITFKGDRTVLNVAKSINVGSNALDLLLKSPGVRSNAGGEILLSGKNGLNIYINGKSSNLTGSNIYTYLQTLSSSEIEEIEIITNPSSKYEASGNAGIINIVTKRNKFSGFNGEGVLNSNFSRYKPKYISSLNLNYRNKKLGLNGNYNNSFGDYRFFRENLRAQTDYDARIYKYDQKYLNFSERKVNNFNIGVDYNFDQKNALDAQFAGSFVNTKAVGESRTITYYDDQSLNQMSASNTQPQNNNRLDLNLNYRYKDTVANEINFGTSYRNFRVGSSSSLLNTYYNATGKDIIENKDYGNENSTEIFVKSVQLDYVKKIASGNINAGAKINLTNSDNEFNSFRVANNLPNIDLTNSNRFTFKERLLSAYLEYSVALKPLMMRIGLRGEDIYSKGDLDLLSGEQIKGSVVEQFKIFPSIFASYNLSKSNTIALAYNKRIDRPPYRNLRPFVVIQDDFFFETGNPFLKPQYTDNVKLSFIQGSKLTISLLYDYVKQNIITYRDTAMGSKTFESKLNLDRKVVFTLAASAQLQPFRFMKTNLNMTSFREDIKGLANQNYLSIVQYSWNLSFNNSIKISKKIDLETFGIWNSQFLDAPAIVDRQWTLDVAAQFKCFNNDGRIKLAITDLFNTWGYTFNRDFGGLKYSSGFKPESQQLRLSFSYKFGTSGTKASSRDKGYEEASKRLK